MELLAEPIIVTARGAVAVLGKMSSLDALGVTKRYSYVSTVPLLYAISVPNLLPLTAVLQTSDSFVAHWPKNETITTQAETQQHKQGITLATTEAETVEASRLTACAAYMECEIVQRIPCGDHTLFIGQVRKREW